MVLEKIIPVVVVVLIAVVAWGLFKKVFKLIFYAGIAIVLVIAASIYLVYSDVSDLRENFDVSEKKIALVGGGEVLTAFTLNNGVNFLDNEGFEGFSLNIESGDYENALGGSYRLLVFDIKAVENFKAEEIEINGKSVDKGVVVSALKSEEPFLVLNDNNVEKEDLGVSLDDYKDKKRVKAALFGKVLEENILSSKNPLFLLSEFKKDNIVIYPESALFKAAEVVPLAFLKDASSGILGKTKESAKTLIAEVQG